LITDISIINNYIVQSIFIKALSQVLKRLQALYYTNHARILQTVPFTDTKKIKNAHLSVKTDIRLTINRTDGSMSEQYKALKKQKNLWQND